MSFSDTSDAMEIREKLSADLKQAMRARNSIATETIRSVRAAILNREVDAGSELDSAAILQVIRGLVKQRIDSIEQYTAGGRQDLVDRETTERDQLQAYLPVAPDDEAVKKTVSDVIAALSASGMKDMGKVMAECKKSLGPDVNGKLLSSLVKQGLTG